MSAFKRTSSVRLTLADGIPPLKRQVTETGASIPTDDEHKAVTFDVKPFGCLSAQVFDKIKNYETLLMAVNGRMMYSTENDITKMVVSYLRSILDSLGLIEKVEVYTEIGVFRIRPDVWIVVLRGYPVGVIEVKKPDAEGQSPALDHPNVLGELNDLMCRLKSFHGVTPVFGLLTNFVSWRVAWFSEDNADEIAAQEEDYSGPEVFDAPPEPNTHETSASQSSHELVEEDEQQEGENEEFDIYQQGHLSVSKIYRRSDPNNELSRAVTSAILKMLRSSHASVKNLSDLSNRRLIKFGKGDNGSSYWAKLNLKDGVQWNKMAGAAKYLYALQDLGHGAHGRVWLTCTNGGAVCVLKFSLGRNPKENLDKEKKIWDIVYGGVDNIVVYREKWGGHHALRMPHFTPVSREDRAKVLPLVEDTLKNHFNAKGIKHDDVAWRNVGVYQAMDGMQHAVVFDMGSTSAVTVDDSGWQDRAIDYLRCGIS